MSKSFYDHFRYSMNSVGLEAPESLFKTQAQATATIGAMAAVVKTYGTKVTIGELVGAGALSDLLLVAAGLSASFYAGACIGAFFYALGQWSADSLWSTSVSVNDLVQKAKDAGIAMGPREAMIARVVAPRMTGAA